MYHFGVAIEASEVQHNLIFLEGKVGKGLKKVALMLNYTLHTLNNSAPHFVLWFDNNGGQDKDKTIMQFLFHLTKAEHFETVDYKLQVKGYTQNICNCNYGYV